MMTPLMMTQAELLEFFDRTVAKMRATMEEKNSDYTGSHNNAFDNFTTVEFLQITDTERGFLTRMTDKFKRIISFVNKGVLKVSDEKVEDTLIDLANYSILMAAYVASKKEISECIGTFLEEKPKRDPRRKAQGKKR